MRIFHVIPSLDPKTGGPPMVVKGLASAQALLGHETHIVSYRLVDADERIKNLMHTGPGSHDVKLHWIRLPSRLERLVAGRVRHEASEALAEADIIHIHGVWDPLCKASADAACATLRKPYVITPHGMLDPWSLAQKAMKKRLALTLGYRQMLNHAALLQALNTDEKSLLAPLQLTCPIAVIPNGIFLEELQPLPAAGTFAAKHPELNGQPFVLFLSRLHYKKGLDFLIDAFAMLAPRFPSLKLVIAGPDEGEQSAAVRAVQEHQLNSRVLFTGPLYGTDKLAAYVDAMCFCLPSRQEGFSIAILESLAVGTPVVISENCHFPEVAQAHAGEVTALSAKAIADALARIAESAELRQAMSVAGRKMVAARYTWPAIAARMIEAYETALTEEA